MNGGERRGRANVHGCIVNNYRARAGKMRLAVEGRDAALATAAAIFALVWTWRWY